MCAAALARERDGDGRERRAGRGREDSWRRRAWARRNSIACPLRSSRGINLAKRPWCIEKSHPERSYTYEPRSLPLAFYPLPFQLPLLAHATMAMPRLFTSPGLLRTSRLLPLPPSRTSILSTAQALDPLFSPHPNPLLVSFASCPLPCSPLLRSRLSS